MEYLDPCMFCVLPATLAMLSRSGSKTHARRSLWRLSARGRRDATARLGYMGFSASIAEEEGALAPFFSPEGSHHEQFDQFGDMIRVRRLPAQ